MESFKYSTVYTLGVAQPCKKIHEDVENVYKYTSKGNIVDVVTKAGAGYVISGPFEKRTVQEIAATISKPTQESGVAGK